MIPAIVVSAYNRPEALRRLLSALRQAAYPANTRPPLVISIDRDDSPPNRQVYDLAKNFEWPHGPKEVIYHPRHLGLVEHVFFCGGLTERYAAVIFLEDDLGVSPVFYFYAQQALSFYDAEPQVGGVSLYALWFNGYTHQPFTPLADAADAFFLQIPYTQGQAWTRAQWQRFTQWRQRGNLRPARGDNLHPMWLRFDEADHFPIMTRYLVTTGQYYVVPRVSHTTGFGDAGVHFSAASAYFQAPLQYEKTHYELKPWAESGAVYDSFFEILPDRLNRLTNQLLSFEYAVDLYATKQLAHFAAEYVLTTRACRSARLEFGQAMWPLEANVLNAVPGRGISVCRRDALRWGGWAELQTRKRNHDYFNRQRRLSRWLRLQYAAVEWLQALRRS